MEKQTKKILFGIFATIGAILLFVGIFSVGKKENLFTSTFKISTVFTNVNGLKAGDYVRFSGVRGGIVESITFLNDSMIKVVMKMDKKMQHLIMKDAKVYIETEGLVGNKILEIRPSWKSKDTVVDNDELASVDPFDTHQIIEKLLETNDNATVISDNLANLSTRLINHKKKSVLQTLVNDTAMASDLKNIVASFKSTGHQLAALSLHLEKITGKINMDNSVAGVLLTDTSLKQEVIVTLNNLQSVSANSANLVEELNKSINEKNYRTNTLGILLKDSTFAGNLRESIENFRQSTRKLDENMEALQHNILLKKYFKKKKEKSPILK
jgi:phospholipid/cholesterol/gamma-HCH transport system substrate-binding protein